MWLQMTGTDKTITLHLYRLMQDQVYTLCCTEVKQWRVMDFLKFLLKYIGMDLSDIVPKGIFLTPIY